MVANQSGTNQCFYQTLILSGIRLDSVYCRPYSRVSFGRDPGSYLRGLIFGAVQIDGALLRQYGGIFSDEDAQEWDGWIDGGAFGD